MLICSVWFICGLSRSMLSNFVRFLKENIGKGFILSNWMASNKEVMRSWGFRSGDDMNVLEQLQGLLNQVVHLHNESIEKFTKVFEDISYNGQGKYRAIAWHHILVQQTEIVTEKIQSSSVKSKKFVHKVVAGYRFPRYSLGTFTLLRRRYSNRKVVCVWSDFIRRHWQVESVQHPSTRPKWRCLGKKLCPNYKYRKKSTTIVLDYLVSNYGNRMTLTGNTKHLDWLIILGVLLLEHNCAQKNPRPEWGSNLG